jgi:methionyl-tRNA synthetase
VTINGQKMSKSRGTFITARRYLDSFTPEYLRYYFAAKLSSGIDDIDMNLDEFSSRCNSDIVGKLVNIASRCAGFITKNAGGTLANTLPEHDLYLLFAAASESIAAAYEARDTAGAIREIMSLADRANQYIDLRKPWTLAKQATQAAGVQSICTQGLNLFRVLMIYLQPVLPEMAAQAQRFFQESAWSWDSAASPLLGTTILPYQALATRLDPKAVARLIEPEADSAATPSPATATATPIATPAAGSQVPARIVSPPGASDTATLAAAAAVEGNLIAIDEFLRVDLRVAKVLSADLIAGADKLLKLRLDVGELGERDIFAGIRAAYDPKSLVGRLIIVVANLEPRKMRFGVSEGMLLAAGPGGTDVFVLSPDSGASPGMRVK